MNKQTSNQQKQAVTETYARKMLRHCGYGDDLLQTMNDEDCEAELSYAAE